MIKGKSRTHTKSHIVCNLFFSYYLTYLPLTYGVNHPAWSIPKVFIVSYLPWHNTTSYHLAYRCTHSLIQKSYSCRFSSSQSKWSFLWQEIPCHYVSNAFRYHYHTIMTSLIYCKPHCPGVPISCLVYIQTRLIFLNIFWGL